MDNLEKAIYLACKAFVTHYDTSVSRFNGTPPTNTVPVEKAPHKPVETSNDIPKCPVHDRVMALRRGPRGDFYSCSAKENDPSLSNRNGYCRHTINS